MQPTDKLIPNFEAKIKSPEMVAPWFDRTMGYWLAMQESGWAAEMVVDIPDWHYTGEYEYDLPGDPYDEIDDIGDWEEAFLDSDQFEIMRWDAGW